MFVCPSDLLSIAFIVAVTLAYFGYSHRELFFKYKKFSKTFIKKYSNVDCLFVYKTFKKSYGLMKDYVSQIYIVLILIFSVFVFIKTQQTIILKLSRILSIQKMKQYQK